MTEATALTFEEVAFGSEHVASGDLLVKGTFPDSNPIQVVAEGAVVDTIYPEYNNQFCFRLSLPKGTTFSIKTNVEDATFQVAEL